MLHDHTAQQQSNEMHVNVITTVDTLPLSDSCSVPECTVDPLGQPSRLSAGLRSTGPSETRRTSFVGLLGTSAPLQRPAMAISRNLAPGVLL